MGKLTSSDDDFSFGKIIFVNVIKYESFLTCKLEISEFCELLFFK